MIARYLAVKYNTYWNSVVQGYNIRVNDSV